MQAFDLVDVISDRQKAGRPYLEFLRLPALSAGLYELPAEGEDRQMPHREDEVYFVVSGRAKIRVGDEERQVQPNTIVFVPAGVEHRFIDIAEDLSVLVFFAPAESAA